MAKLNKSKLSSGRVAERILRKRGDFSIAYVAPQLDDAPHFVVGEYDEQGGAHKEVVRRLKRKTLYFSNLDDILADLATAYPDAKKIYYDAR